MIQVVLILSEIDLPADLVIKEMANRLNEALEFRPLEVYVLPAKVVRKHGGPADCPAWVFHDTDLEEYDLKGRIKRALQSLSEKYRLVPFHYHIKVEQVPEVVGQAFA